MPRNKPESYNKVTTQQIEEWTSSFDRLLASDRGRDMFMEHLLHEGTERHLEFWLRCQRLSDAYKQVKDDANAIYETFLDIDAPKKVNVYREAEAVRQRLEQKETEGFGVFEEAQYKVKARMEQDSYPGFCVELMKTKKSLK